VLNPQKEPYVIRLEKPNLQKVKIPETEVLRFWHGARRRPKIQKERTFFQPSASGN